MVFFLTTLLLSKLDLTILYWQAIVIAELCAWGTGTDMFENLEILKKGKTNTLDKLKIGKTRGKREASPHELQPRKKFAVKETKEENNAVEDGDAEDDEDSDDDEVGGGAGDVRDNEEEEEDDNEDIDHH